MPRLSSLFQIGEWRPVPRKRKGGRGKGKGGGGVSNYTFNAQIKFQRKKREVLGRDYLLTHLINTGRRKKKEEKFRHGAKVPSTGG